MVFNVVFKNHCMIFNSEFRVTLSPGTVFKYFSVAGRRTDMKHNRKACCSKNIAGLDDTITFIKHRTITPFTCGCAEMK